MNQVFLTLLFAHFYVKTPIYQNVLFSKTKCFLSLLSVNNITELQKITKIWEIFTAGNKNQK